MNRTTLYLSMCNFAVILVWAWIEFSFSNYLSKLDYLRKQSEAKLSNLSELVDSELVNYKNTLDLFTLRQIAKAHGFVGLDE